ncbi:GcvT family protein [Rubrobacter marinus]|uniref:GcvT family protein n=1 Tax=Rubrobacter marinus TaxID=2653852 RepID=UPI001A9F1903|nr:FAD-dependent oxidoreductase [Rubrobacter marinus]
MEARADVVIVGAGIVGCAVAEHLTRMGWRDVVVLDQGPLFTTGGSTSHAPGLVFQTNPSKTMSAFACYGVRRYGSLRSEGRPCFRQVGSIEVAATPARWRDLERKHGLASSWGIPSALLTARECVEKVPLLDGGRILGGYYVPSDGIARAVWACEALSREARSRGAVFHGETEVTGIDVEGGRVRSVETSAGRIETGLVVSCAGMWGPRLGRMAGVSIPLVPMQHQYARTGPLAELAGETEEAVHPILRHQDASMYFRQVGERYGVGSYGHRTMPVSPEDIPRHGEVAGMPSVMPFTPEDFEGAWRDAVELLPALGDAGIEEGINGLFSFTPDGLPLLGETREVGGLWVAEAVWVTHGPGVGRVVAEWIARGVPSIDLRECDVNRFEAFARSPAYVRVRSDRAFREVYDIIHPQQPIERPRPLRTSPFYARQGELGAYFLEASGWERPQWFGANERLVEGRDIPHPDDWAGRYWSPIVGAEHGVTRERVALYDMTPLKKVEVTGPGALAFLQGLNTNELDKPVGTVTYTLMLDEEAGVRSDVTVARLGEEHFQVGCNGVRDLAWMEGHLPKGGTVRVRDITAGTCCVGVWGPMARELVQSLSEDDLSNESFGFFRARGIHVGEVPVVALRLSYVGELGWELYASADMGLRLWDLLWRAGRPLGAIAAGRGAFNGLRLEKGYRMWGTDVTSEHDPYEAGLGFAVKPEKGEFVGREALERRRAEGPRRKLACLVLEDPRVMVLGNEPVFSGDAAVGYVTSAAYGHTVGQSIAYAWLPPELAEEGTWLDIGYFGERYAATVADEPLFDPAMKRMRS